MKTRSYKIKRFKNKKDIVPQESEANRESCENRELKDMGYTPEAGLENPWPEKTPPEDKIVSENVAQLRRRKRNP